MKAQTEQRASFLVEVGAVPGDETLLGDEVATSESLKATLASAMVRTPHARLRDGAHPGVEANPHPPAMGNGGSVMEGGCDCTVSLPELCTLFWGWRPTEGEATSTAFHPQPRTPSGGGPRSRGGAGPVRADRAIWPRNHRRRRRETPGSGRACWPARAAPSPSSRLRGDGSPRRTARPPAPGRRTPPASGAHASSRSLAQGDTVIPPCH